MQYLVDNGRLIRVSASSPTDAVTLGILASGAPAGDVAVYKKIPGYGYLLVGTMPVFPSQSPSGGKESST